MNKIYVIMSVGWEYNDEYYYLPESEGGQPHTAHAYKAVAEKECELLNIKAVREWGWSTYTGPQYYFNDFSEDFYGTEIEPNISDEEILRMIKQYKCPQYEVVEVEMK